MQNYYFNAIMFCLQFRTRRNDTETVLPHTHMGEIIIFHVSEKFSGLEYTKVLGTVKALCVRV